MGRIPKKRVIKINFEGPLGMPVILSIVINCTFFEQTQPTASAVVSTRKSGGGDLRKCENYNGGQYILRPAWNACYFAARLECLLFCGPLGMPVILRPAWNACYFAARLECLLFCEGPIGMPVILRRPDWNACYFAKARFSFQIYLI